MVYNLLTRRIFTTKKNVIQHKCSDFFFTFSLLKQAKLHASALAQCYTAGTQPCVLIGAVTSSTSHGSNEFSVLKVLIHFFNTKQVNTNS